MKPKNGYRLVGLPRNEHTKRAVFPSTIELYEKFKMKDVADRIQAQGHIVTSIQALGNYARQYLKGKYIKRLGLIKGEDAATWERIA